MVFELAVKELGNAPGTVSKPESFIAYCARANVQAKMTAPKVSVDSYDALDAHLKTNQVMVLRLGADPNGQTRGTRFTLCRPQGIASLKAEFFVDESQLFADGPCEFYLPDASIRALYPFLAMPKMTESSYVNLAMASGILTKALRLENNTTSIPATGQSTFTFEFNVFANSSLRLMHYNGQVEIDAVFLGRRNDQDCLFVVEAKNEGKQYIPGTLAKHKLMYACYAIASRIEAPLPVVPVYLKTSVGRTAGSVEWRIVAFDPVGSTTPLTALNPSHVCSLITNFGSGST